MGYEKDYWYIGRDTRCDLIIPDPRISRIHCTIVRVSAIRKLFNQGLTCGTNVFLLLDGKFGNPRSSNGLFVGQKRVFQYSLHETTGILLGGENCLLEFISDGDNKSEDNTDNTVP